MRIVLFSTKPYERTFFESANLQYGFEIEYCEARLNTETAALLPEGAVACCFVNDTIDQSVIDKLKSRNCPLIALRSAGYNHVEMKAAKRLKIPVCRVPEYSPYAVAEHAVGLILMLNRQLHRAYNRVREHDFSLHGLMGFDLHGATVGIIGTGAIGSVFARIMSGFGMRVLAYDPNPKTGTKVEYVSLDELVCVSDIISIHCPLVSETHHIINAQLISKMKDGVMIINTSRGAVIDTRAVIDGLKSKKIGYLGIDVYEEETDLFFEDLSDSILQDDCFARLQTFPNVIITGHQAFFTKQAMENIASITLSNINSLNEPTIQNVV